jgi:hypothetical protein
VSDEAPGVLPTQVETTFPSVVSDLKKDAPPSPLQIGLPAIPAPTFSSVIAEPTAKSPTFSRTISEPTAGQTFSIVDDPEPRSPTFPSLLLEPALKSPTFSGSGAEPPEKEQTFSSVIADERFPTVLDVKTPPQAADGSPTVAPRVPPARPRSTPPTDSNLKFKTPSFAAIDQRQRRKGAERRKAPERPRVPEFSPKSISSSGFYASKTPLPDFSLAVRPDRHFSEAGTRYH